MPDAPDAPQPDTTEPVARAAMDEPELSGGAEIASSAGRRRQRAGLNTLYGLGPAIQAAGREPAAGAASAGDDHGHRRGGLIYRPLWIFTLDPSTSRLDGATALVNVPYEPLRPGPEGRLFKIELDAVGPASRREVTDLEDPEVLIRSGYLPSSSNFRFHGQMLYAVCSNVYATFRAALGRDLDWGSGDNAAGGKLVIRPHHLPCANACYDAERHELHFGHTRAAPDTVGRTLPGSEVYACLSHDIIAHELSHALLHGLRRHYLEPCGPDALAFHEAFADLVAIFQHFSYREVVLTAIRKARGTLEQAELLTSLARQFGHMDGSGTAIRSAVDVKAEDESPAAYDAGLEPHRLGSVLVSAVFEAFVTVFKRKTARYIRLATNGTGVLPKEGELPVDLQAVLAEKASRLASQFLSICIRAIDYCPPVNPGFGEYLQALVTADYNLVPDDPWAYREALIDAFRRRKIHPHGVFSYAEEDLLWPVPSSELALRIEALSFTRLRFQGDPGRPLAPSELKRRAAYLGEFVTRSWEHMEAFGLVPQDHADTTRHGNRYEALKDDFVDMPYVESLRSARRIGPSGQVIFDTIAEVVQTCSVRGGIRGQEAFDFHGGCTIILGPNGEVRYIIRKSLNDARRLDRRLDAMRKAHVKRYWEEIEGPPAEADRGYHKLRPKANLFQLLDGVETATAAGAGGSSGRADGRTRVPATGTAAVPVRG